MAKHLGYLVVEGPHDVEFVARLLKVFQFGRIKYKEEIVPFWHGIIPTKFPHTDGDLLKRMPVPMFFENDTHSIAIQPAGSDTKLAMTLYGTCEKIDAQQTMSYGFILDSDKKDLPQKRTEDLTKALRTLNVPIAFPDKPGEVTGAKPFCGIYVLPDNQSLGTLEDVLLECADVNYANLKSAAQNYLDTVDLTLLKKEDVEELHKPAGKNKAHIGSIASILKPGKAIQVSIQDNRWLEGAALDLPRVKSVSNFLAQLFRLG